MGPFEIKSQNANPFLTFPQVQFYLGIKSRKTILKYIRNGILPAYKLGGTRWRIAEKDVRDFLDKHSSGNGHGDGNGNGSGNGNGGNKNGGNGSN
ncbi:MAG: helix-turn-helix domain-containing protein [Candidatus Omnitrophica bacterium]|nr:helix-turn-helix domain-containing protein [Candidatus Omnitrophota bacterium]